MQDLYEAMNKMLDPSLVRTESDELTYPMHIILRCSPCQLAPNKRPACTHVAALPSPQGDPKMRTELFCTSVDLKRW